MHATSAPTPPSTPEPGGSWSEFRHVRVTRVIEDSRTSPQADIEDNQSWKLICVPADQIETSCSKWFDSEPGIDVVGKTEDGKAYEIVINASYVQWLFFLGYEICLDYDPTAPIKEDILVHGVWEATKRGHTRFLRNAVNRIRSGCSRGYEECCRDVARSNGLRIPLERALLTHDILVSSSLFSFPVPLTFFRNLIHLFASFLHNILCSLV